MPEGAGPSYGPAPSGISGRYVRRAALIAALDRGAWLTALVAGPGAGKTALLSAWAEARAVHAPGRTAWLTLGPEHGALPVLRRGLADALRAVDPSMSTSDWAAMLDALGDEPASGTDEEVHAAGLASILATGLDRTGAPQLVLVLDGAHYLPAASPASRFVEELCRHAPAGLRLVVASRTDLPFPVDRLAAAGRVTLLGESELGFADFETYQLLTLVLGDATAADTLAAQLQALAAGRPGLVALGAAWLAGQPAAQRRDRLDALGTGTANALAEYLAREVFAAAEPGARELVRRAAYLPRVSADLCRALDLPADSHPARAIPLLTPGAGTPDWYEPAAGVRRAVIGRAPLADSARERLLAAATRWYAEHGRLDDAVVTAAAAQSTGPVLDLLTAHGPALLAAGRAGEVAAAAARVPAAARTPELDLVEGEARHLRGDAAGALACLERLAGGDGGLAAPVAYRIGQIHQAAGDLAAALASFQRARLDEADPAEAALVLAQTAIVHWGRGDITACREAAERALTAATASAKAGGSGADRALAAAHTALAMAAEHVDDWAANAEHMAAATEAAVRAGDLNQQIRLRTNASRRLLEEGRHGDALVQLDEAMRLIEATGSMDRYGIVRTNRGWAYRAMGRLDEAVAELEVAARFWRDAGSGLLSYALVALGAVYLVRGDLSLTEEVLDEALTLGDRSGDYQALAGLSTLARARYATDPDSAWALAERALDTRFGVWRTWALLTAGWFALHGGDRIAAVRYAAEAAEAADARRDASGLAEAVELHGVLGQDAELLREAQARWARLGNPIFVARAAAGLAAAGHGDLSRVEARLRALGVRPEAALAAGPLRAAGAFAAAAPRPFLPTARAGLDRFADGDLGGAQQLLSDAVASVNRSDLGAGTTATYLDALRALASASAVAGETDVALRWYLRLLELDSDDESGHLGVVITLARDGRHEEARRRYRAYTDRMRARGAEPAPYPSEWTLT